MRKYIYFTRPCFGLATKLGSLVPRPFPFLRALGTRKTRARGKIRERPGTISHVR